MSDAFSAIMMVAAFVLPETMIGIMDASTTRRLSNPWTRSEESTTASASDFGPMRHVPLCKTSKQYEDVKATDRKRVKCFCHITLLSFKLLSTKRSFYPWLLYHVFAVKPLATRGIRRSFRSLYIILYTWLTFNYGWEGALTEKQRQEKVFPFRAGRRGKRLRFFLKKILRGGAHSEGDYP